MELSRSLVEEKAEEYRERQPLSTVEEEHREILPGMLAGDDFGRRDAEWVVQWYFRRYLGAYPDRERRAVEEAFGDNAYEEIRDALAATASADDAADKLAALRSLDGVDVPVASAFLFFISPGEYVVVGDREWRTLREAGVVDEPYPDPPSVGEYLTYLAGCRTLADEFDVDLWTLYRALWRLGSELEGEA